MKGKHYAPKRPPEPIVGVRSARTMERVMRKVRRRLLCAGTLMCVAAIAVAMTPVFRHYVQDSTTDMLLQAFKSGSKTPLNINLNDYASSGREEAALADGSDYVVGAVRVVIGDDSAPAAPYDDGEPYQPPDAHDDYDENVEYELVSSHTTSGSSSSSSSSSKKTVSVIGSMRIPSIDLEMPVVEGAGTSELRYALGHHPVTPGLGEIGFSTVFGHRMYSYGRHFNRLDEVVAGESILVTTADGRALNYIVDEILEVLPGEVPSYMQTASDRRRLMLVTCTPVRVASHRLLVIATLEEDRPAIPLYTQWAEAR